MSVFASKSEASLKKYKVRNTEEMCKIEFGCKEYEKMNLWKNIRITKVYRNNKKNEPMHLFVWYTSWDSVYVVCCYVSTGSTFYAVLRFGFKYINK